MTSTDLTTNPVAPGPLVHEFQRTFRVAQAPGSAPVAVFDRLEVRYRLVAEEFAELTDAVFGKEAGDLVRAATAKAETFDTSNADVVEILDALCDLVVVEYGWADEAHLPIDDGLAEVHRSNMSKLDENGDPILRADGKILKGANYSPADLAAVIEAAAERAAA